MSNEDINKFLNIKKCDKDHNELKQYNPGWNYCPICGKGIYLGLKLNDLSENRTKIFIG